MDCNDPLREDLVALIQGELESARADAVRAHAESCAACRAELEALRGALEAPRAIPEVQVSENFNAKLREKISAAKVAKAAPAASETQRAKRPSSRRVVSGNFSARRRDEKRGPGMRYVAAAAAVVLVAVGVARFVILPKGKDLTPEELMALRMKALKDERRDAPERWETVLGENAFDVAAATQAEKLYLVPSVNNRAYETCIVAYTADEIDAMKQSKGVDQKQLEAMMQRAITATVVSGEIRLPKDFATPYLGRKGSKLVLLKLKGRMEVWSAQAFDSYIENEPNMEIVPSPNDATPDAQGVPPQTGGAARAVPTV